MIKEKRKKHPRHPEGIVLAFILIILFVMSVLAVALHSRGIQSLSNGFYNKQRVSAYYAAQAGMARALYAIQNNDSSLPSSCGQTATPVVLTSQSLVNQSQFTVTVTNNYGTACTSNATAQDGTIVPPSMVYLSSAGVMGNSHQTVKAMVQETRGWSFLYGAFGANGVTVTGNGSTDDFNSSNGLYGGSNVGSNGNIGTNSSANGAISLSSVFIHGSVNVGPGGTAGAPTISTSNNAQYNSASVLSSVKSMPSATDPLQGPGTTNLSITSPYGILPPGTYGTVNLSSSGTLTLTCGIYSIAGVNMSGSAQIFVDQSCGSANPVKLYVYNSLSLAGNGVVNNNEKSTALLIYGMPSLTTASVSGNVIAAYLLYAPNANITVSGNGDIFGSLVGNSVTVSGNGNTHYDNALSSDPYIGFTTVTLKSSWNSKQ